MNSRIALLTLVVSALVAPAALAQHDIVPAHALAFEMNAEGVIQPIAHALRDRELEPKTEEELQEALEQQRAEAPVSRGRIVLRARDAEGNVIYRAIEQIELQRRTYGTTTETVDRIPNPLFSTVVPAAAVSIEFEGWLPASDTTFLLSEIAARYGEQARERKEKGQ
jgi:hypothetical protein